ncbi:MvaI/BcnI restriction endonuclease family protein [Bradyrhizobium sp. 190]|uniref:MvaI/BcnI family restriction endonuclease n=1 Tax=Bradyrhizobium sp. 190 TaxID=2782658 RepID=UPI001FF8AF58|nr:MvaI/BcnI family restriction endonuclease [Bradyrhizobium sp. 190]MCK1513034.1 MvaI/BcnI restriction endonuclease family protein [Bradyrhizobium sp. 190]
MFSLKQLREALAQHGVTQLLFKELAANDNSKNQPYLGGNLEILNLLPMGEVREETTPSGKTGLKAPLPLHWLRPDGSLTPAPNTQIILYPQYPEIRMSGFLKGAQGGPNELMTVRQAGRMLFLGITSDRRIVGWVTAPDSPLADQVRHLGELKQTGVFRHIPIGTADTSRERLIQRLLSIHQMGWIASQRLDAAGSFCPCNGSNCGGYTLEAHLGVIPNGKAEPDFEGWEIKGHSVTDFVRLGSGNLTLMTPEPTGGLYKQQGAEAFVRRYGYADQSGIIDRLNFSSPHRYGMRNEKTGLTLQFIGYDVERNSITDPKGGFTLADDRGNEAATWHFAGLIEHWNRKHAKAAYVPYKARKDPAQEYSYGGIVRLAEDTDFLRFLKAMAERAVIYDPGIKLEGAGSSKPTVKRRSQFRVKSADIEVLYANTSSQNLLTGGAP